jgi:hypothetical protein
MIGRKLVSTDIAYAPEPVIKIGSDYYEADSVYRKMLSEFPGAVWFYSTCGNPEYNEQHHAHAMQFIHEEFHLIKPNVWEFTNVILSPIISYAPNNN